MPTGLSPQFIMRASLARACKDKEKPTDGANTPYWQTAEGNRQRGESEIECLNWYPDYAEPGYTNGEKGILTADWNPFHRGVTDLLEKAGYATEWSDEWTMCDNCGKALRTSPDCYFWQRSFVMLNECDTVCFHCVDWQEYLETIEDNPNAAVMQVCNPAEHGYVRLSNEREYENGLHPGQTDSPKDILKALHADGWKHIVFRVPETSQFYVDFETWVKAPELSNVIEYLEDCQRERKDAYYHAEPDSEQEKTLWQQLAAIEDALEIVDREHG